ncbi:MAG: hypothetical protein WBC06_07345 [Chitinophagaceae bacterium]
MDYSRFSFVITGFPRSGTAWISQLLSLKDNSICLHEPETMLAGKLNEILHTYETVGCASSFPSISQTKINCEKAAIIRRPINDCATSFECKLSERNIDLVPFFQQSLDYIKDCAILIDELNEFQLSLPFNGLFNSRGAHLPAVIMLWEFCYGAASKSELLKIKEICKMNIQTQTLGGI